MLPSIPAHPSLFLISGAATCKAAKVPPKMSVGHRAKATNKRDPTPVLMRDIMKCLSKRRQ